MKVTLFFVLEILLLPFFLLLVILEKVIEFLYRIIVKPRYVIRFIDWIDRIEDKLENL